MYLKYSCENGNGVLKMINKSSKIKIMDWFTWLTNKQTYSNNVSIPKKIRGQRNKQATTKCSIKIADRQVNKQQFLLEYDDFTSIFFLF